MATYSKSNFIIQPNSDTFLRIKNIGGMITYTFYHNTITSMAASTIYVVIKTSSDDNVILLDFGSNTEAIQALGMIQEAYAVACANYTASISQDTLVNKTIFNQDNGNFIANQQIYYLINAKGIQQILINGISYNNYTFDVSQSKVTMLIADIGHELEADDEITIFWI